MQQATAFWAATGLTAAQQQALASVNVQVADLAGARLGQASGNTITIDANAAGYGWYADGPGDRDDAFRLIGNGLWQAHEDGPAAGRMDLLTVVMHELAHVLGQDHQDHGLLASTLAAGTRKLA